MFSGIQNKTRTSNTLISKFGSNWPVCFRGDFVNFRQLEPYISHGVIAFAGSRQNKHYMIKSDFHKEHDIHKNWI